MHSVQPWIVLGGDIYDDILLVKYLGYYTVQHGSDVNRHDGSLSVRSSAEGSADDTSSRR
ncbi:hypothetical protein D6T63_15930 [Arthrobacter cheniae]|uniref:Uncharacterized protein n=1 Tax=Arthrobacter cheniae TaxID=1258888 RepID=A0A3A5MAN6_9MICC|nr:hypothetical protein D6T63_15930 [Arthrobacter cheniae]